MNTLHCATSLGRPRTALAPFATAAVLLLASEHVAWAQIPAPPDLALWWQGENDAQDAVGASHGSQTGAPGFTAGLVGQAFTFDSDDDLVSIPHAASMDPSAQGFTIEFWVRLAASQTGDYAIIEKSHGPGGWAIQGSGGAIGFALDVTGQNYPGVGPPGAPLADHGWHHLAFVVDRAHRTFRCHLDGALVSTNSTFNQQFTVHNTRPLRFGSWWGSGTPSRFFRGDLDEVSLYSRSLCTEEIRAIYAAGALGKVIAPQPPPNSTPTPMPANATNWWRGEGHLLDQLGGEHGAGVGAPLFSNPGQVCRALSFDSDDDQITVAHATELNPGPAGFTVEFWVRASEVMTGLYAVVDKSHGFVDPTGWVCQGNDGSLGFGTYQTNGAFAGAGVAIPHLWDFCWHHFAGVFDPAGGQVRAYIDGSPAGSVSIPGLPVANNVRPLRFGHASGGGTPTRFFRGSLDEVTLYDRALSPTEIGALYAAGAAGKVNPSATISTSFCPPLALNSSNVHATISATGSELVTTNDVTLTVSGLPTSGTTALLFNSQNSSVTINTPFSGGPGGVASDGRICIGGGHFGRHFQEIFSGTAGTFAIDLDLGALPHPEGPGDYSLAVLACQTWYWQCWYRDAALGVGRSNFSAAIAVTFR